jgi:hypothetical protein
MVSLGKREEPVKRELTISGKRSYFIEEGPKEDDKV